MATENGTSNAKPVDASKGTGRTGNSNNPSAADAGTGRPGTGAGSGNAGTGTGTGTGTGKTEKKKPVEVAILTPPTKEEAKEAKAAPAPKKKKAAKKKAEPAMAAQISALLQSVSLIVAGRPGMEHWAISEAEAQSIAEPLGNIIENSETLSKVAEHSDGIALVSACAMVIGPRAMVSMNRASEKKKQKPKAVKGGKIVNEQGGKTDSNSRADAGPIAGIYSAYGEALPATASQF